jgi:hypothetical protein
MLTLLACGPTAVGDDDPSGHIEITPADATVTIVDGAAVMQAYKATLVATDGDRSDVTSRVSFSVADPAAGVWSGSSIKIQGGAAGKTRVLASLGSAAGETGLTIYVKGTRTEGNVPANAGMLFENASETAARAPAIAYPANLILVPANLGEFDVHWRDTTNNLIRVSLKNEYVDLTIFKAASGNAFVTYTREEWYTLASARAKLELRVSGLNTASPNVKGTATQRVEVTNDTVQGGVYYWATAPTQGIYRYDMSTPNMPPASFFPSGTQPTPCIGCHAISRDGAKIALTLDDFDGRGAVFDVADRTVLVPFTPTAQNWNFATFNPDATKLVTSMSGQMVLRSATGGNVLATLPNTSGRLATHPELSPDGTQLASVETPTTPLEEWDVSTASIVTRTFDSAANTFGPIRMLVPFATGASNFYPSWSPDGQWIVFTRANGTSNSNIDAQVWAVKADGTKPPIRLAAANVGAGLTNSWARWAPFVQSFGSSSERVYYLTFSTTRAFGVRAVGGPQIWMSPFFPDRAEAGQDPSGPAFRLPFQLLTTSNHIAQWTQAVVIGRRPDGSLLTQAAAIAAAAR